VIRNDDGRLSKKVYRKPTNTDKYLNFLSHHHISQKISVIDSLVYRALKICDACFLEEELDHIRSCLLKNNYPLSKINNRIAVMKDRVINNLISNKSGKWVSIPFVGDVTYRFARLLRKYLSINIGYLTGTKFSTFLSSHKDKSKCETISPGIYSVQCKMCPKKYVGETKRDFVTRFNEHLVQCRTLNVEQSAIALHLAENEGHTPNNNSLVLIEKEPRKFFRKVKESLYIRKCVDSMNTNQGWKVHPVWSSTLIPLLKPV
jgi:hypothetical protein